MDGSLQTAPMRIWDAPTRLFHWALVTLVGCAWLTQEFGRMELHFLCGYSILALLLFRLAWGFAGSDTARFARFLKSPFAALQHLAHLHHREPDTEIGHNAAGGWMVLVMLALLAVQVGTGLCSNDDALAEGPLFRLCRQGSERLADAHPRAQLHPDRGRDRARTSSRSRTYAVLKRHDLVRPMITGRKYLPEWITPPRLASPLRALVLFVIAVAAVGVFVNVL